MLDANNPDGYAAPVWRLFRSAPRSGRFPPGTPGVVSAQAGTRAARSVLRLEFLLKDHRVADARFQAYGCPSSIAVGAWIADWAIGRSAAELGTLSAAELRAALEMSDDRAHCALMGEDCLRAALTRFPEH